MATKPKNKTSLRVGQTVWDGYLDEFVVTDLQVLSNKVIYFYAEHKDSKNHYGYDCVLENRKDSTDAKNLGLSRWEFYTTQERAKMMGRMDRDNEFCHQLGYELKQLVGLLKTIRL